MEYDLSKTTHSTITIDGEKVDLFCFPRSEETQQFLVVFGILINGKRYGSAVKFNDDSKDALLRHLEPMIRELRRKHSI